VSDPARTLAAAHRFAKHFADHPAIIVALVNLAETLPTDLRDQGVAATLTALLSAFEPQVEQLLGVPVELSNAAFVVVG
jgi:hypothetical protein